jgi:hypothetical protein
MKLVLVDGSSSLRFTMSTRVCAIGYFFHQLIQKNYQACLHATVRSAGRKSGGRGEHAVALQGAFLRSAWGGGGVAAEIRGSCSDKGISLRSGGLAQIRGPCCEQDGWQDEPHGRACPQCDRAGPAKPMQRAEPGRACRQEDREGGRGRRGRGPLGRQRHVGPARQQGGAPWDGRLLTRVNDCECALVRVCRGGTWLCVCAFKVLVRAFYW